LIQSAIVSADSGDTVVVGDGTYKGPGNANLDLSGKAISLKSVNGPLKCIIDVLMVVGPEKAILTDCIDPFRL